MSNNLDEIVAILEQIRDDTVPGLTQAVNNLSDATTNAGNATRNAADATRNATDATRENNDTLDDAVERFTSMVEAQNQATKGMAKFTQGFKSLGKALTDLDPLEPARQISKFTQDMRRSTGMSKELAQMTGTTTDSLRIFGVTAEEAKDSLETLYTQTSVFSQLSTEMQANMVKESALMKKLGVDNQTFAAGIEVSMKAQGMTADQAVDNLRQLRATAIDLDIPVAQLTKGFSENANMIAKLGENGVKAFGDLSVVSKATGLEINKLLAVTDKFDTFEGAADAAGSLNAALGGNFVDSMSLMMETDPAERFKMIRGAVEDAGLAFEDMGYFQKKMMTEAMGLSDVNDLSMALSGNLEAVAAGLGETDASLEAAQKDAFTIRTPEEIAKSAAEAAKPAFGEIANTLTDAGEKFATSIQGPVTELNNASIRFTQGLTAEADKGGLMLFLMGIAAYLPPLLVNLAKFKTLAASLGTIFSASFGAIGTVLTTIGGALTSFPAAVIATIAALTAGFVGVAKKFDQISALFTEGKFLDAFSLTFMSFFTGIIAGFGKVAAYVAEMLGFDAPWITTFKDAFSPKTFDKIMDGVAESIANGFNAVVDFFKGIPDAIAGAIDTLDDIFFRTFTDGAESAFQAFKDFFQISSPSKLMTDLIGGPMIDGILAPFTDIGSKLKELMMGALEMVPEPIRDLMLGKSVFETAGDLAGMAADKAAGVFDAVTDAVGGDEAKEPYVLNISLNMDGREIDRKVINVVGGIAKGAVG